MRRFISYIFQGSKRALAPGARVAGADDDMSKKFAHLNKRIDTLKELTLPEIRGLKKSYARLKPGLYDNLRMFTYYIDKEFSLDQKNGS